VEVVEKTNTYYFNQTIPRDAAQCASSFCVLGRKRAVRRAGGIRDFCDERRVLLLKISEDQMDVTIVLCDDSRHARAQKKRLDLNGTQAPCRRQVTAGTANAGQFKHGGRNRNRVDGSPISVAASLHGPSFGSASRLGSAGGSAQAREESDDDATQKEPYAHAPRSAQH
jgi:hypothetical protein